MQRMGLHALCYMKIALTGGGAYALTILLANEGIEFTEEQECKVDRTFTCLYAQL